jgi:hypothetical protein
MKRFLLLAGFAVFLLGCQKIKEQIQEDLIVRAITDGEWRITNYTKGGTDMTADYTAYRFQFFMSYTVDAINNGTIEKKGTWQADVPARTVGVSFTNTSPLLLQLNGNWRITRNSWTFVEATQMVNGETLTLRIDK